MSIKYDPQKSTANLEKHGIDLDESQMLWDDPDLLEVPAKTVDEPRWLVVGKIAGKHWSEVITYRHETTRLISVRLSRQEEIELYES